MLPGAVKLFRLCRQARIVYPKKISGLEFPILCRVA
jgi:hypothetical protein